MGHAEDVGLLLVDAEGQQLLFEGDNKRYRIPAHALTACGVEYMDHTPHNEVELPGVTVVLRESSAALTVLRAAGPSGERELPLRPLRTLGGDPLGTNYGQKADALRGRIRSAFGG